MPMFTNLTIKKKLTTAFSIIILISLLSNAFAIFQIKKEGITFFFFNNNFLLAPLPHR